jgi:hypothetical protein
MSMQWYLTYRFLNHRCGGSAGLDDYVMLIATLIRDSPASRFIP